MNFNSAKEIQEYVSNLSEKNFSILRCAVNERVFEANKKKVKHAEEAINDILADLHNDGFIFDDEKYFVSLIYNADEKIYPAFE